MCRVTCIERELSVHSVMENSQDERWFRVGLFFLILFVVKGRRPQRRYRDLGLKPPLSLIL